jgi:glutamyl-Q tRNA(Asp) synthetase
LALGRPGGQAMKGRFAPSPTGPLHAGSVVAALGSWLDARASGAAWIVRIEDVDKPRCPPGMDRVVLQQLDALGLRSDEPPVWQSQRDALYAAALQRLVAQGRAFPCACTRKALAALQGARERHGELIYPGTCREGLHGRPTRAWRLRVEPGVLHWQDARLGVQQQDVAAEVGDFVLQRADGLFAYQLAVVVDDAEQGITQVVRGEDLADNTPRQVLLQQALGLPRPSYRHLPLVRAADGQKLSKQNGAAAIDTAQPLAVLQAAGAVLGLPALSAQTPADWRAQAVLAWRADNPPLSINGDFPS